MRVYVGGIATETNSFSPIFVGLKDFKASLYAKPYQHPETPTLCTGALVAARIEAKKGSFDLVEGTTSWADPGGMISRSCFERLRDEIISEISIAHNRKPLDAVMLCLHGAMLAQGYDDPEGDLIKRIRNIVGNEVVIGASLDPHSHLSPDRVEFSDILVTFKEFPHTDFYDTGVKLVDLVLRTLKGEIKPKMAVYDCKMIDVFPTNRQPMRGFVDCMMDAEEDGRALSLSLIHGFMAGDSPYMGTKMIAIHDEMAEAEKLAEEYGRKIIAIRGESMPISVDEVDAVIEAFEKLQNNQRPVVITDVWDNPGGGVAGDSTVILEQIIQYQKHNQNFDAKIAIGTIWDPVAVSHCFNAGVGAEIPLRFGAKSAPHTGEPIDTTVKVLTLNETATQSFGDYEVPMGASATIQFGNIKVILNSTRAQAFEPDLFSQMDVDPNECDILVVKSTNHFFAGFSKISDNIIFCDAGKPYPNDPKTNPYQHAPTNIWPRVNHPWD